VSGLRLLIGVIVMGIIIPVTLFLLLGLNRPAQLLIIAATTFISWCVADVLATILSRPRLQNRTARGAFREDWERRSKE
jgi:hypothetical protein